MNFKPSGIFTLLFLSLMSIVFYSCFKTENFIKGDAKIRFYNVVSGPSQDFYLGSSLIGKSIAYGSNSDYIVVEGDKAYNIFSKNAGTTVKRDSLNQLLEIGNHYSVYYTKKSPTDSMMVVYKDTLTLDTARTRIKIINLGYTLSSSVVITDSLSTFSETLSYGQRSKYFFIKPGPASTMRLRLSNSTIIDRIPATSFIKNKAYTIVIDGSADGKLQERLVPNN